MFSTTQAFFLVLTLAGPGIPFAGSAAQPSAIAAVSASERVSAPAPDVYVQQQLDWRSYYLHRIDGSRTEGRTGPVPGFRPGV